LEYYSARKSQFLDEWEGEARRWHPLLAVGFGETFAAQVLNEARQEFSGLIPEIPYIGGDENHLTGTLVQATGYLAFYQVMRRHGKTAAQTGKILFDAALAQVGRPQKLPPPGQMLTQEDLMERRRQRANRSQARRYPADYVYEFVPGDGLTFDYGYNFSECAVHKFYHACRADEFTPFYCYLDFPLSKAAGTGLQRSMTLSEGDPLCNHRFRQGREVELVWPPPFFKSKG